MCVAEVVVPKYGVIDLGDLQLFPRALRQTAHFGINRFRDLPECQGTIRAADENPAVGCFDVLDGRLEQLRGRSNYPFLEQPRRQGSRSAGQHRAAARIGPGAVRDDGAVALQDADIVDPGAEFVCNDLCQGSLESLAV